jgi:hypothetical protein
MKLLNGEKIERKLALDTVVVSSKNVDATLWKDGVRVGWRTVGTAMSSARHSRSMSPLVPDGAG